MQEFLEAADIINLQEHWLFEFEKDLIDNFSPGYRNNTRSVDGTNNISALAKPRGYGGVSTLWKNRLDHHVHKLPDGNERIVCTAFDVEGNKICILNCYLESARTANAMTKYKDDIGAINELLNKYEECTTFLVGDLNADIYNRDGPKEKLIRALIDTHELVDPLKDMGDIPTYRHVQWGHKSHIDMILIKENYRNKLHISQAKILDFNDECNAINSSTHVPVSIKISISEKICNKTVKTKATRKRMKWEEANEALFAQIINQELEQYKLENIPAESALKTFQSIVHTATVAAVPSELRCTTEMPRRKWFPELKEAVEQARKGHFLWKEAGKPDKEHPASINRSKTRKHVRRVQRQNEARKHRDLLDKISHAVENEDRLFYKLIKRQRATKDLKSPIRIGDEISTDDDKIREEWARYFEELACRKDPQDDQLLETYLNMLRMNMKTDAEKRTRDIDELEVCKVINSLRNGKAADLQGATSEQLKMLPAAGHQCIAKILTEFIKNGKVPCEMKAGFKIPLPKPGKDITEMANYRGITITSIYNKVLEHVILHNTEEKIDTQTNSLQFGFSKGKSPTMASLCLSEAISESRDNKDHLYVATLDASKAFDVVDHNILKKKLHGLQLDADMWNIIDNLYSDCQEVVRWEGEFSRVYQVMQGVRQGGILSPHLYKMYINNLLDTMTEIRMGLTIGNVYIGTPTCADDLLLLSRDEHELQAMLMAAYEYSTQHKYAIHPQKSKVTHHQMKKGECTSAESREWRLGDELMATGNCYTHLGLEWEGGRRAPNIDKKVESARKVTYALLGVGLHGRNGLDAASAYKVIQTYVTPRLTYGLDCIVLLKKDYTTLELFYRKLLKQIQGLPDTTASVAVYLMLDAIPLEAQIHMRILGIIGNITRLPADHPLRALALRQLAMKNQKSTSWFIYASTVADTYQIDLHQVIMAPWPKQTWKQHVKTVVVTHWQDRLREEALTKSSLKMWVTRDENGNLDMWKACQGKTFLVEATVTRLRMLTGRYQLQTTRAKYNQYEIDTTCPLCKEAPETITHFLMECGKLEAIRRSRTSNILIQMQSFNMEIPKSSEEWSMAVLNGGWFQKKTKGKPRKRHAELETACSRFCEIMHTERDRRINSALMEKY